MNKINHIRGRIEPSVCLEQWLCWERVGEGGQQHVGGRFLSHRFWVSVTRRTFCCCWEIS